MMKKLAFLTLILVFLAGGVMGCIDQSVPEIPTKEEMPGYSQGWSDGKQRGFTTGYVAYLRANNLSEEGVNYDMELTPKAEQLQGYSLGEQQGYNAAWGYGYDSAMSVYEPVKWDEMGYIVPGNETATDFYAGLGYDINEYKTGGLTDVLKEGTDQAKGLKAVNVKSGDSEVEVITYKSKATNSTAVTYGKEADGYINYKDCIYDVVVTGDGDKFTNNMKVSDGEIAENGSRYTAPKVVKFKAGSDLATKVR
jgi:hypothetical protein